MNYANFANLYVGVRQGSKKHKQIVDTYNSINPLPRGYKVTYTDSWCATFASFVLFSCKCKKKVFECSAERMRKKCKKYFIDSKEAKKNDLIFYDWNNDKWSDHVGIIYQTTPKYFFVIEGNKDKKVGIRKIKRNSTSIFSIARV